VGKNYRSNNIPNNFLRKGGIDKGIDVVGLNSSVSSVLIVTSKI
jgi:hypothetical protein